MLKLALLLTLLSAGPGQIQPAIKVNIRAIAGKTPAEVSQVLGKPEYVAKVRPPGLPCNPCDQAYYRKGRIDILFIAGRANRIAVSYLQAYGLKPATLAHFGLPVRKPTHAGDGMLEWVDYPGLYSVRLFGTFGQAEYLDVRVQGR